MAGIAAILGSSITLSFYWKKDKIVPFLYRLLAVTDILTGLDAIYFVLLCLTYLHDCNAGYYNSRFVPDTERSEKESVSFDDAAEGCHRGDTFLIPASFVITVVVTRVPLFIGVVLSLVRAINIMSPFTHINKPAVALTIALWAVVWTGLAIASSQVEMWFDEAGLYAATDDLVRDKDNFYRLLVNNPTPIARSDLNTWKYMLMLMISFILPIAVMLISTIVQLASLFLTRMGGSDHFQMTLTIIMITALAAVCAMPSSFYIAASWAKREASSRSGERAYQIDNTQAFLYGFGLPVLNSALNPLLLITRSKAMRQHVRNIVRGEVEVGGGRGPPVKSTSSSQGQTEVASFCKPVSANSRL